MKYRKRIRFICIVMLISLFVGCDTKEERVEKIIATNYPVIKSDEIGKEDKTQPVDVVNNVVQDNEVNIDNELLPNTEYLVKEINEYLCYEVNEAKLSEYFDSLVQQGYELVLSEIVEEIPYYHYTNGDIRIQVVDANEVLIVTIVRDYMNLVSEESKHSSLEILEMVQAEEETNWNNSDEKVDTRKQPAIVLKCWISDLYEKTKMEAYTTYTKEGKASGSYLIYGEEAFAIIDSLENTCIADLDKNGRYELLSLYGWGSGIYRIHLNVYQYGNPIYFSGLKEIVHLRYSNCFVPNQGYGQLKFHIVNDNEVHLMENEENGEDYGKLMIAEDGVHIVPENLEDFPYYQWDYDYQPPRTDSDAKEQLPLEQVPTLTVKVSDTTITNQSAKIDWNGVAEDPVAFGNLIYKDTPMFDSPNFYEFKDEICLMFEGANPTSIQVRDYLIHEDGEPIYGSAGMIDREVRFGEEGTYYFGLMTHFALMFSSNMASYTTPSYRGFRVTCEFGEGQTCEYAFVLSVAPTWEDEN